MFLWLALLTGVVYPLCITGISELTMRKLARGSLLLDQKHRIIGSRLIGQKFEQEKYFWSRPSASNYDPLTAAGSNLGPTSAALKKAVAERKKRFAGEQNIPSDLLFSSASGLDPHITPEAAYFQVARIAKARNIDRAKIETLIQQLTEERDFGLLGMPRINVLQLNLKLDELP